MGGGSAACNTPKIRIWSGTRDLNPGPHGPEFDLSTSSQKGVALRRVQAKVVEEIVAGAKTVAFA
jgi:hypothetical protein